MILAQIYRLALRQLDEAPEDLADFRELFEEYVNEGYDIAVDDYWQPRREYSFVTDDNGCINIRDTHIHKIISVKSNTLDVPMYAQLAPEGYCIKVFGGFIAANHPVTVLAQVTMSRLVKDNDVPRIPESAHMALVDYICYRYKMTGNLAKQSQANAYLSSFRAAMARMPRFGHDTVVHQSHLYEATSLRWPW